MSGPEGTNYAEQETYTINTKGLLGSSSEKETK